MAEIDNTIGLRYKPIDTGFPDAIHLMTAMSQRDLNAAHAGYFGAETNKLNALLPSEVKQQEAQTGLTNAQAGYYGAHADQLRALTPAMVGHTEAQTNHEAALSRVASAQALGLEKTREDQEKFRRGDLSFEQFSALHPVEAQHYAQSRTSMDAIESHQRLRAALATGDYNEVAKVAPESALQLTQIEQHHQQNLVLQRKYDAVDAYYKDPSPENLRRLQVVAPDILNTISEGRLHATQAQSAQRDLEQKQGGQEALEAFNRDPSRENLARLKAFPATYRQVLDAEVEKSKINPFYANPELGLWQSATPTSPAASPPPARAIPSPNSLLRRSDAGPALPSSPAQSAQAAPAEGQDERHPERIAHVPEALRNWVVAVSEGKKTLADVPPHLQESVSAGAALYRPSLAGLQSGQPHFQYQAGVRKDANGNDEHGTFVFDTRHAPGPDNPPTFLPNVNQTNKAPANAQLPSAETLDRISTQIVSHGDYSGTVGLGRNPAARIAIEEAVTKKMKDSGKSPSDISLAKAEYAGMMAGERALGNREATMGMAAETVKTLAPQALQWSEKVDRSRFSDWNKIANAWKERTGDENVVRFSVAINSLANAYAGVMSGGGQVRTDDARKHAYEILQRSWSQKQFSAGVDQLGVEMEAELKAPGLAKQHLRELYGATPPAAAASVPHVNSKDGWDMLTPGTRYLYIYSDGRPAREGIKGQEGK